jgi:signal transduction histidine kinase
MKKFALLLVVFMLSLSGSSTCFADSPEQAVRLVKKAVAFFKANGLENALEEFSNPKGQFKEGEVYIFAYDLTGTMLAHPNPALIGHNLTDVPDADGNYFRKEFVTVALTKGSGWVDYKYQNPKTKLMEHKTTYVEKVDDIIICCGIFK